MGAVKADEFAVPSGVDIFPAGQLAPGVQLAVGVRTEQFAVTKADGRATTRLVDRDTAELLEIFQRGPVTLVQAILEFARAHDADPAVVLELAYPTLRALISDGFLVRPSAGQEDGAAPADDTAPETVTGGTDDADAAGSFGEFAVVATVQRLIDTTVYQGQALSGEQAAIKVLRGPGITRLGPVLHREATVLRHAAGCAVPALLHDGSAEHVPYLAMQWIEGRRITDHADTVRRPWDSQARVTLLRLAVSLLDAYVALHERGVVHADVHPKNVLIGPDGNVTIIDFGFARVAGITDAAVPRVGVMAFWEPEWAQASAAGRPAPAATTASDQFALGALIYLMLTGRHYVEAVGELPQVIRRIAQEAPRPFTEHGLPAWPGVEAVLARMLAKRPGDRFADLAGAAAALRTELNAPVPPPPGADGPHGPDPQVLADLLGVTTRRLSREGGVIETGLPTSPRVSANFGAVGVAYFFYRLAIAQREPRHLLTAIRWIALARQQRADPLAFHDRTLQILPERVGRVSIYHSPAGTAVVRALIAGALGDSATARDACAEFVVDSGYACDSIDVTVGRTSTVLGAALLTEGLRGTGIPDKVALTALGDRTLASVLRSLPLSIAGEESLRYRGIAHGWAGLLYTSLRWCQATRARIPDQVLGLLDELAGLETIRHGHSSWAGPHDPGPDGGWCHGTAGYTHLWALAAAAVDEEKYAPLAARAAAATRATPARAAHLCCGLAGQAYAMLVAYQLSGEARWLRHAVDLAARASAYATTRNSLPNSLWKGDVGVACLAVDLESPAHASVPLFGRECWPAEAPRGELRELPV